MIHRRKNRLVSRLAVLLTAVAVTSTGLGVVSGSLASAATCPAFEFIGARGSGESAQPNTGSPAYSADNLYGMGGLVDSTYEKLAELVGKDRIGAYGVHYAAVGLKDSFGNYLNAAGAFLHIKPLGAYTDSVRGGTSDVIAHIEARHAECSSMRFVLAGYSQGAQAVGDALQTMPDADRSLVVGAAFFGDPYFNAKSWSSKASDSSHYGLLGVRAEWPESLHGKVFSYCRPHDPICGISKRMHILGDGDLYYRDFPWYQGFDPHGAYASSKDNDDAARQLARILGSATPVSGTVPLDLVFNIDTTGSMGSVIADVRNNITSLAQSIAAASSSYRFALVDYKDSPEQGDPYRSRLDLPFTTDVAAFSNAVNPLTADGGGDTPESVYSGVQTALEQPWRNGVRKIVLTIGDAPGKDPEPGTGLTLDSIRAKALAVDPAQVYTVATTTDSAATTFMSALADATGGKYSPSPSSADLVATLKDAISAAGSAPVADAGGPYSGVVNDPVLLSGAGSRDEAENITAYDWDFDADGTYDQTTSDAFVSHTFTTTGSHDIVMRARAASGLASTATSTVAVAPVPAAPSSPVNLQAKASDGSVTLTWTRGVGSGDPTYYTITDGSGAVVDQVAAQADGSAPPSGWADTYLANGSLHTYKVSAGNPAGESAAVGPVSATAGNPSTAPVATADAFTTDQSTPLSVPAPGVLANDTGDGLTAKLGSPPAHGKVSLLPDGSFTYTPDARYTGSDSFSYTAVDVRNAASAPAKVSLTVSALPAGPVKQRLVLVGNGKPPVVLVGRLSDGSFVIKKSPTGVESIIGTGTLLAGTSTSVVTMNIKRSGRTWTGTIIVRQGTSSPRTFNLANGTVVGVGKLTVAAFGSGAARIGFTIMESPR